jgi:hypothetical protein
MIELRATNASIDTQPSEQHTSHLQQVRSLDAAYQSLIPQDPYLPSPGSPLPALLALRISQNCIDETEACITETELDLKDAQTRLEEEEAYLSDAKLIRANLERRSSSLQVEIEERSQKTPGQIAKEMISEMKRKKTHYDQETGKLIKAFNEFIDEHLAPMLAIEELGGPIVGEVLHVDEEMLEGGFNTHGKTKRMKSGLNGDKRQRRIDEIWGSRPPENGETMKPWNEKQAAAAEMRELAEQLLNSLVEAEGGWPGAYVELERESAAARFLVRSKVAQFHPKDARKMRLVDFGGEIQD